MTLHPLFAREQLRSSLREFHIQGSEVHVWRIALSKVPIAFSEALDDLERVRAARFYSDRDRRRFTAARSSLRHILASYTGIEPAEITFTLTAHGKPSLPPEVSMIRFNLSHSEDLMLLALVHDREVGVDVERVRGNLDLEMLIEQNFDPGDAREIQSMPPARRTAAFFRLWTRTEACLKAAGVGITNGLRIPDRERWSVRDFIPAPDYAAALAVEGKDDFTVSFSSWPR